MMEDEQVACTVIEPKFIRCPKTMHNVLKEYEFGFSGLKPIKERTADEMGRDQYKYYQMNAV